MKKDELFIESIITSELVTQVEKMENLIDDYFSFNDKEKQIALYFMRSSIIDCLGKLFGVIDGVSFIDGFSGKDNFKLFINNEEIQGDLHDIFNEKTDRFIDELHNMRSFLDK